MSLRDRFVFWLLAATTLHNLSMFVNAQSVSQACQPVLSDPVVVSSAKQRLAAGNIAQPPLTDSDNGFAWPDTPIGVLKTDTGYEFFGSDGGLHTRQIWEGHSYGNNRYGSVTRTLGALDNPLGSDPACRRDNSTQSRYRGES